MLAVWGTRAHKSEIVSFPFIIFTRCEQVTFRKSRQVDEFIYPVVDKLTDCKKTGALIQNVNQKNRQLRKTIVNRKIKYLVEYLQKKNILITYQVSIFLEVFIFLILLRQIYIYNYILWTFSGFFADWVQFYKQEQD